MLKILFIGLFVTILQGCQPATPVTPSESQSPPFDPNPPAANCAADGPDCKQFNPNKS